MSGLAIACLVGVILCLVVFILSGVTWVREPESEPLGIRRVALDAHSRIDRLRADALGEMVEAVVLQRLSEQPDDGVVIDMADHHIRRSDHPGGDDVA